MSFDIADFVSTPSCETFLDHHYIPPDLLLDDETVVCSNQVKYINFSDVVWPKQQYAGDLYQFYGEIKAHLDTGAKVTVSNLKYILHNYKPYTCSFKCPVRLIGAIDKTNVVYPEGEGFLHIPAEVHKGYIRVRCYYSPRLTSTLLSENDVIRHRNPSQFSGQTLRKHYAIDDKSLLSHLSNDPKFSSGDRLYDYENGNFTLTCHHKLSSSQNIVLRGSICSGQCYTQPLILPDLPSDHPQATIYNSSAKAKADDPLYAEDVKLALLENIYTWQQTQYETLMDNLQTVPSGWKDKIPFMDHIMESTPIQALKAETEKLLWHQQLGHPHDDYLMTAHKFIDGVPQFSSRSNILDNCPTCIRSKMSKSTQPKGTTKKATQPHQGLSIDFAFSGIK